jgi:hypothetical protein
MNNGNADMVSIPARDLYMNDNTYLETSATRPPRVYTLREAAQAVHRSYFTLYRAVCRGDLKVLKGFGRLAVSEAELNRFLGEVMDHVPRTGTQNRPPKKRTDAIASGRGRGRSR